MLIVYEFSQYSFALVCSYMVVVVKCVFYLTDKISEGRWVHRLVR